MNDFDKEQQIDNSLCISPSASLIKQGNELTDQIASEQDPDKLKDLTELFKMNMRKKDIARMNRLSGLVELVDDEIITRFTSEPESFDNDQLVKYMTSTQQAINGIEANLNAVPTIQINNQRNEIHISNSGLDRDSRARVLSAVNSIIDSLQSEDKSDIIDITPEEGN